MAATALAELQRIIALPEDQAPARTVWVTRGAIAAADGDPVAGLAQSVLWGWSAAPVPSIRTSG
ncbi:hypothetical protein O1M54_46245 [Streptomyces diastatochromogenes]|nr:hypothetical protein [Streptomyces diastatochromogenes]